MRQQRFVRAATTSYGLRFGRSSKLGKAYQVYFQMDQASPPYLFGVGRNRQNITESESDSGAATPYFDTMGRVSS